MPFITPRSDTSASDEDGDAMAYTKMSSDIAEDDNTLYTKMPGVDASPEHIENYMEDKTKTPDLDVDALFLGKFDLYVYTTIRPD